MSKKKKKYPGWGQDKPPWTACPPTHCPPPGYFFLADSSWFILSEYEFVSIIIKIQVVLSGFLGGSISYLGCRGGGQAVQGGLSCPPPG